MLQYKTHCNHMLCYCVKQVLWKAFWIRGFLVNSEMIHESSPCTAEAQSMVPGGVTSHGHFMGLLEALKTCQSSTNDLTIASPREIFSNIIYLITFVRCLQPSRGNTQALTIDKPFWGTELSQVPSVGRSSCLKELTLLRGLAFKHGLYRTN